VADSGELLNIQSEKLVAGSFQLVAGSFFSRVHGCWIQNWTPQRQNPAGVMKPAGLQSIPL
jgi:hypothetical protein